MERTRSTLGGIPRIAYALVVCALIVRVALVASTSDYTPVPPFDAYDYHRHASSIAAGDGYPIALLTLEDSPTAFRPPFYPYLLGATYKLAPGTLTAGRLLGALLGGLAVLFIFLLADRLWNRRVAVAAGAIAAIFPPLVVLNSALTVESLFVPLELGLVLAVLAYQRSGGMLRWALLGGIVCGLAALTRQNGFVLAVPLLLGLFAARGRGGLRQVGAAAAVALLATLVVVSPWLVRNAIVFDRPVSLSTTAGYALRGTFNDLARNDREHKAEWRPPEGDPVNRALYGNRSNDEADIDHELLNDALDYLRAHPGYAVEATAINAYRLLNPRATRLNYSYDAMAVPQRLRGLVTTSYFAVALLAIGGAALAVRRKEFGPLWLWSLPLILGLSFAGLNGDARYRTTLDPFIILLAAIAVASVAERFRPALSAQIPGAAANPRDQRRSGVS